MTAKVRKIGQRAKSKDWQRFSWYLGFVLAITVLIASLPGYVGWISAGVFGERFVLEDSAWQNLFDLLHATFSLLAAIMSVGLGWLIFRQRSEDRMAVYLSVYLLFFGIVVAGPADALSSILAEDTQSLFIIATSIYAGPPTIALITLFPDGQYKHPLSRWLVLSSVVVIPVSYIFFNIDRFSPLTIWAWMAFILSGAIYLLALYVHIYRYRHTSTTVERQQTKWVVYGLTISFGLQFVVSLPYARLLLLPQGSTLPLWYSGLAAIWEIGLVILPISLTIAIMRYRLYDIDILINRTLVYGGLTAITMGVYILVVGYLGELLQVQNNSIIPFIATGLVAVMFQPLRRRLQDFVNRTMYGERDDPFSVITQLSVKMEAAIQPEVVLPTLVETVAQVLKLPFVAIEIGKNDSSSVLAATGQPQQDSERFPLTHQSETIGHLVVACRGPGEKFTDSELKLLRNIARQAGVAVHAVQLTADLRRSRQELVSAREEERRRLRRDLHDGLGPVLASQGLKIAAASQLLDTDPGKAKKMLEELASQNETTLEEIRQLVYALRPAVLDELGFAGAVRDFSASLSLKSNSGDEFQIKILEPKNGLPPLPAAIEVAAYRIATEALTNVFRHSKAQYCEVSFKIVPSNGSRFFHLEITDDGVGLPQERKVSLGMTTMRERAEEIGGSIQFESYLDKGTRVSVHLPFHE
jgi:signal transduction histidine kinase